MLRLRCWRISRGGRPFGRAALGDEDQGHVELPVAAAVEAVADRLAERRGQGRDAELRRRLWI